MSDLSGIVPQYSSAKVLRSADIEMVGIGLALENVDVGKIDSFVLGFCLFVLRDAASECKSICFFLACRVVARRPTRRIITAVRLRQGYGATVFAPPLAASKDWSLGDSNP